MKENRIKEVMKDIHLSDKKREEIWEETIKKAERNRYLRKRMIAAAAILALLLIPTGVYAATRFQWIWDEVEEKNQQLNTLFKQEYGCVEANGFRFRVEQAMCDKNMGIGYYYISVTDTSGKGRNPLYYYNGYEEASNAGDIIYSISIQADNSGLERYDEKNSTSQTAYFYIEKETGKNNQGGDKIEIEFSQIEKITHSKDGTGTKTLGKVLGNKTIEIKNIIQMPTLTWKIGQKQIAEVKLSPVIARIRGISRPEFEIIFKNGKAIRDYFDFNQEAIAKDGTLPDNHFTSKTNSGTDTTDTIYRFDYFNLDDIRGIRVNGTFYPVEKAEAEH